MPNFCLCLSLSCVPVGPFVSHSRVFCKYWPYEYLMDLVGRVQTLWDSGIFALITLCLFSPQSPPFPYSASCYSYFLSPPPSLPLSLHPFPSPPGLAFLSSLFSRLDTSGTFTYPSSCDKDEAVYTFEWMHYRHMLTVSQFLVLLQTLKANSDSPPHTPTHTFALVVSHFHAKAQLVLSSTVIANCY